jgi:hypothetical protein
LHCADIASNVSAASGAAFDTEGTASRSQRMRKISARHPRAAPSASSLRPSAWKRVVFEGHGGMMGPSLKTERPLARRVAGRRLGLHGAAFGTARRAIVGALAIGLSGCYSYTYRGRGPAPDFQRIAIENRPHEEVRWSSWWGGHGDEWSPLRCEAKDAQGRCTQQIPYCDYGLGQVEVSYTAASVLLTIVTLGIAVPMRVRAWCATDSGPHSGP